MSVFKLIATATGVVVVVASAYYAQKAAADTLGRSGGTPEECRAARMGATMASAAAVGGAIEFVLKHLFPR